MTLCGRAAEKMLGARGNRGENNILARMKLSKLRSMPNQRSERFKQAMEKHQGNFLVVLQQFTRHRGQKPAQQKKNCQFCKSTAMEVLPMQRSL